MVAVVTDVPVAAPPCPLKPLSGYVVVREVHSPRKTTGGILLPDNWRGKYRKKKKEGECRCGVVAAVGPGKRLADGSFAGCDVAVGDKVVYKWFTDTQEYRVGDGGTVWVIVEEDDLITTVVLV